MLAGPQEGEGGGTLALRVRHSNGDLADYTLERPHSGGVENPVAWSVEQRGPIRAGVIRLSSFNARAVPELQVRSHAVYA